MTAVSAKASGPSAAAAPASVRSCSWSPLSPPNTTRPLQSSATDCSPLEKKKWSSESLSPTNCSSASTQKHAMRVHNTPMQLDTSDSRSPGAARRPLPKGEVAPSMRQAQPLVLHHHGGADGDAVIEIGDVVVGHAEAAGGYRLADGFRLVGAMDAVQRRSKIHRPRPERVVDAAGHMPRQIGASRQHLRGWGPARPFLLGGDAVDAA